MKDYYRRGAEWKPLKNGKCGFCGCSNKSGERQHIRVTRILDRESGEELGYGVYCDNCSAQTKIFSKEIGAIASWRAGDYTIPVHSEKNILEGCISLLRELTDVFKDYLDYMGIEQKGIDDEQTFSHGMSVSHIVNKLFLYHTNHSGGTSTSAKCQELGVRFGGNIPLTCGNEDEEDDE